MKHIKKLLRPVYYWYRKYFSEVGYVTRAINLRLSYLLGASLIRERKVLARRVTLAPQHSAMLEILKHNGGIKTNLHSFNIAPDILQVLKSKAEAFGNPTSEEIKKLREGKSKTYWLNTFDENDLAFAPVLAFATHKDILALVAAYLGEAPTLQEITYYYSPADMDPTKLIGSQGWHLDNEQPTKLKIFLSPFEMTLENGPTTFLPLSYSNSKLYKNYPNYFDEAQAQIFGVDISKRVPMLASPGEFYMADTSRVFHYGARAQTKPRWILIVTYAPVAHHLFPSGWRKHYTPEAKFADANAAILRQFS